MPTLLDKLAQPTRNELALYKLKGVVIVLVLALISQWLGSTKPFTSLGLGSLTLGIGLGAMIGNTLLHTLSPPVLDGVDFAKGPLLRLGMVLFGLRLTFSDIADVGVVGVVIDVVVVVSILCLAMLIGRKALGLDVQTSLLIGAGSAICGAAAILATEPVVKGAPHKVSVAIATVVTFGTLSLFAYPAIYHALPLTDAQFSLFVGATVHEVAQVVAIGSSINEHVADMAVVEKMVRVMLLAPVLMVLSSIVGRSTGDETKKVVIPWFAFVFIAVCAVNSLDFLSDLLRSWLLMVDQILLTMAMVALGLRTNLRTVCQVGKKPFLLAAVLYGVLLCGGLVLVQFAHR
ncbi:YeiH family protein [Pseudoalteromonas xiamenensis]